MFVGVTLSSGLALLGIPAFALTVPSPELQSVRRSAQSSDFALLLEFFDPANPLAGYQTGEGCSLGGNTATCAGATAPFALLAQVRYVFELARHDLTPAPAPASSATAVGATLISVPSPAPIGCSPSSDTVGVNQTNIIICTEQDYSGPFALTVADPTIASVQQADSASFTFFSVTGLRLGTTTLSLRSQAGVTGSLPITVAQ
jgi:hypothetical protein